MRWHALPASPKTTNWRSSLAAPRICFCQFRRGGKTIRRSCIIAIRSPRSLRLGGSAISRPSASMATRAGLGSMRQRKSRPTARAPKPASRPKPLGSTSARRSAAKCNCSDLPAFTVRGVAPSTSSPAARRAASSSPAKCSTASMWRTLHPCFRPPCRGRAPAPSTTSPTTSPPLRTRWWSMPLSFSASRRRRRCASRRPTSHPWREASMRAAGASPTR